MTRKTILSFSPCYEAVEWLNNYPGDLRKAWAACPRGDWLLWVYGQLKKCICTKLVCASAACTRLSLRHVSADNDIPRLAVEAAEICAKNPTMANQKRARDMAWAAYKSIEHMDMEKAAERATRAAMEVAWASYTAYMAWEHATRAASWAAEAAWKRGVKAEHQKCADIVRSIIAFEDY
jgi:hypothetical protein